MQVNINNLETNMCSNTFNEDFIKKQAETQFSKFDKEGILQVTFGKKSTKGYDLDMRLTAKKKNYTANSSATTASKCFADGIEKIKAQLSKERSKQKSSIKAQPRGKAAKRVLAEAEEIVKTA